jgi:hypothetical protein
MHSSSRGPHLALGDQDLKAIEWKELPIASHLERPDTGVVEYYDSVGLDRNVLASIPLQGWGGATFAERTAIRMYHAMASGPTDKVSVVGPETPCPHDGTALAPTPRMDSNWGAPDYVESLETDEGGVLTYLVMFELDSYPIRCGHDLRECSRDLKKAIRSFWKDDVECPTTPHALGDMRCDMTTLLEVGDLRGGPALP